MQPSWMSAALAGERDTAERTAIYLCVKKGLCTCTV